MINGDKKTGYDPVLGLPFENTKHHYLRYLHDDHYERDRKRTLRFCSAVPFVARQKSFSSFVLPFGSREGREKGSKEES